MKVGADEIKIIHQDALYVYVQIKFMVYKTEFTNFSVYFRVRVNTINYRVSPIRTGIGDVTGRVLRARRMAALHSRIPLGL